jgi:hypothetical protein
MLANVVGMRRKISEEVAGTLVPPKRSRASMCDAGSGACGVRPGRLKRLMPSGFWVISSCGPPPLLALS